MQTIEHMVITLNRFLVPDSFRVIENTIKQSMCQKKLISYQLLIYCHACSLMACQSV